MHVRQQIIERVQVLVTGLVTTGASVSRSPVYEAETTDLPCLRVRFARGVSDLVQDPTMPAPRTFQRTCQIDVIGIARATSDLDETLSQIALEVERALAMPVIGPWKGITLTAIAQDESGDGTKPIGAITLRYETWYLARENAPDVAV